MIHFQEEGSRKRVTGWGDFLSFFGIQVMVKILDKEEARGSPSGGRT